MMDPFLKNASYALTLKTHISCEIIYDKIRMKQKSLSDHSQNDENHADEK